MQQRRYTAQPHYGPVIPPYTKLPDGTPRDSSSGFGTAAKVLCALALLGLAIATLVLVAEDYSHGKSAALTDDVAAVQGGIDDLADDHDAMSQALAGLADDHDAIQKQLDLIRASLSGITGEECAEQFRRPAFFNPIGDGFSSELAYDAINSAMTRAFMFGPFFDLFNAILIPPMRQLDPLPRWWRADQTATHAVLDDIRADLDAIMADDTVFDHERVPIRQSLNFLDAAARVIDSQCAVSLAARVDAFSLDWAMIGRADFWWPEMGFYTDEETTVLLTNAYWREFIALVADAKADGGFGEAVAAGCVASAVVTELTVQRLREFGGQSGDECDGTCLEAACDTMALLGYTQAHVDECYALVPAVKQAHNDYADLLEATPAFYGANEYMAVLPDALRAPLLQADLMLTQGELGRTLTPHDIRLIGEQFRDSLVSTMTSFGVSSGLFPVGTTFDQISAAMSDIENPDWFISGECLRFVGGIYVECRILDFDAQCAAQTYCPYDARAATLIQVDAMYRTLWRLLGRGATNRFRLVTSMDSTRPSASYAGKFPDTSTGLYFEANDYVLATYDLTEATFIHPRFLYSLTLHEATVGHEMQSDAFYNSKLSALFAFANLATGEGWAFSTESLIDTLINVNGQPAQKMAQLNGQMRRALRLIAYAMLSDEGASVADVIALYTAHGVPAAAAIDDASRLVDEPSQIVSYALGGLYYQETRDATRAELLPLGLWNLPEWMDVYYQIGFAFDPVVHRELIDSYVAWKKGEATCETPYLRYLTGLNAQAEPYISEWDEHSSTQGSFSAARRRRSTVKAALEEMRRAGVRYRNSSEARNALADILKRTAESGSDDEPPVESDAMRRIAHAAAMTEYHAWVDSGAAAAVHAGVTPARVQWDVVNALQ